MLQETEEHRMIRETVRAFAKDVIEPRAIELDRTCEWPTDIIDGMAELGLFGIPFDEKYGGAGLDDQCLAIAIEELGRVDGSASLTLSAHIGLGTRPIEMAGTEEQKDRFLPDLVSGKTLGAFGLTEPGAGSDSGSTLTTARRDGDDWVIDGQKAFCTNASVANAVIVTAVTDKDAPGTRGISALIVPTDTPGFKVGKKENKLGCRWSDTRVLFLEECRVPYENLLGAECEGFKVFMRTLDSGRISIAAMALGLAEGAYERAVRYAKERHAFGGPIAKLQAIQFKIADMSTEIDAARLLMDRAIALKLAGRPFSIEAAKAKYFASEVAMRVTDDAIQIHGGYGFTTEYHVERLYRDAKLTTIGEGTSEVQKMVISRAALADC